MVTEFEREVFDLFGDLYAAMGTGGDVTPTVEAILRHLRRQPNMPEPEQHVSSESQRHVLMRKDFAVR